MNKLITLFWSRQDHRFRSLWRLALFCFVALSLQKGVILAPLAYRQIILLLGLAILVAGMALLLDRRSPKDYGLVFNRFTLPDLVCGVVLSAAIVSLIAYAMMLFGWLRIAGGPQTVFASGDVARAVRVMTLYFAGVAITEEVVFRGVILTNLAEGLHGPLRRSTSTVIAVAVSSLLFSVVHFDNPSASILSGVNIALIGCALAMPMIWTQSLMLPIGFHFGWNLTLMLWGFPVSGFLPLVSLYQLEISGPDWVTGGSFGPEGGVLMTASLLLQIGGYWAWLRLRDGVPPRIAHGIGRYRPVRVFAMTPTEIADERDALRRELDALDGMDETNE
jgi:membrane protease YdiL (CAAX protease family)